MKLLTQTPQIDFNVYIARPETKWLMREGEPLHTLYSQGYLPYSGAKNSKDIFYSGRSARVVLPQFEPTSENRRIAKRFDGIFEKERVPRAKFTPDETFWNLCLSYFSKKHGPTSMPRERLETIVECGLVSTVVIYRDKGRPVAYVLEVAQGKMGHYWFSFYDLAYARQSLGMWLMLDCLRDAKNTGTEHYYLGTVYGEKALYKTNFGPLEWWDGASWSSNTQTLKELGRTEQ